jgi:CubicO group peptidase (beta-lactamase class C family)
VELVDSFISARTEDLAAPYPQAFLLARHGSSSSKSTSTGFTVIESTTCVAAGKSITATLAGVAIHRGAPLSLQSKVVAFFPDAPLDHDDPLKRAITVENLLTMTSGLDADDDNDSSPGAEDRLSGQPDRYRYTLSLPMAQAPGQRAVYSAAGMNLLGGVVQQATRTWLPDFIYDEFARPLDIRTTTCRWMRQAMPTWPVACSCCLETS